MKVRKNYTITILGFQNLVVLTKKSNSWVRYLQHNATCGVSIYDCTFREAIDNLKKLKSNGVDIQVRRCGWTHPFVK
jgi:hypothetical protein